MKKQIKFNPVLVRQSQIVEAANKLEDIRYGTSNAVFLNLESGAYSGKLNCYGLPLQVAKMLGLIDEDADINLSPAIYGQERESSFIEILKLNFVRVPLEEKGYSNPFHPGDILLGKWLDVKPSLANVHHAYIHVGGFEREYYGEMLHAHDTESGGMGKVTRQRITPHDLPRIVKAYRLKGVIKDLWPV